MANSDGRITRFCWHSITLQHTRIYLISQQTFGLNIFYLTWCHSYSCLIKASFDTSRLIIIKHFVYEQLNLMTIAGSTQIFNGYHSSFSFNLTQGLLISFQYSSQTHDNPGIQSQILLHSDAPLCDAGAWAIIQSFAETDTILSETENVLRDHCLGQCNNAIILMTGNQPLMWFFRPKETLMLPLLLSINSELMQYQKTSLFWCTCQPAPTTSEWSLSCQRGINASCWYTENLKADHWHCTYTQGLT